jgi:hypothetical protein
MWRALIGFFSKRSFAAISQHPMFRRKSRRPIKSQETQLIDFEVDNIFMCCYAELMRIAKSSPR